MKQAFIEALDSEHQDPLDAKHVDFDFDEIDRRLLGLSETLTESDLQKAATALIELLRWCLVNEDGSLRTQRLAHRRAIALLWCIRPDAFEGTPSLTRLAKRMRLDKVSLSLHSAAAHRKFGIRNRAQSHGSNFKPAPDSLPAHEEDNEGTEDEHDA